MIYKQMFLHTMISHTMELQYSFTSDQVGGFSHPENYFWIRTMVSCQDETSVHDLLTFDSYKAEYPMELTVCVTVLA